MSAELVKDGPATSVDVEAELRRLVDWWDRETAVLSNLNKRYEHPAFRQIVALGPPVIPVILRDLEANPNWLIGALREITGANPIPVEHRGRLALMAADWVDWGRKNGYRW